jgi:hydroxymethylbilane synthase
VEAERAMNRALHGSCHVPVAAFAQETGDGRLHVQGLVGDAATGQLLRAQAEGPDGAALGADVARRLLDAGAGALLAPPA